MVCQNSERRGAEIECYVGCICSRADAIVGVAGRENKRRVKKRLHNRIQLDTIVAMNSINRTATFNQWLADLKDLKARARILTRILQAAQGNFGDVKPISDGVYEMRIHFGPGYRVYYACEGRAIYLILIGGDKSTQKWDTKTAISMWKQIQKEQP